MLSTIRKAMRRLTPLEVATRELAEAELARLTAQTGAEWAQSQVDYNARRISRLKVFIASLNGETK